MPQSLAWIYWFPGDLVEGKHFLDSDDPMLVVSCFVSTKLPSQELVGVLIAARLGSPTQSGLQR